MRRSHAHIMPQVNPWLAFSLLISLGAAWWVHTDASAAGLRPGRTLVWTALTALILIVGLPGYLLIGRPPQKITGRWGLGEVVGGTVALVVLVIVIASALSLAADGSLPDLTTGILLQEAVTVAIVAYVVLIRYRLPAATVGLRGGGLPRLVGTGLGLGVLTVPISAVAERVAMDLATAAVGPAQAQRMNDLEHASVPVDRILHGPVSAGDIALVIALICVAVPIGEELFFRGFAYGAMRARWSRAVAILVSAVFFSAVHAQIIHFLPIFALGIVLAYTYDRTGSLLPPILVHAVNNLVAVLVTLYGWNL